MTQIEGAAVLRRVELIAEALRVDVEAGGPVTLMRLDALADDLRKGIHSEDIPPAEGLKDA